ncbi:hypothetical protein BC830DRAFT_1154874 [Chytriomyces sp. MP71]|nr:hypothetical protein BC830DRAFT_1154874 [Chytriomyces sp. MP71]
MALGAHTYRRQRPHLHPQQAQAPLSTRRVRTHLDWRRRQTHLCQLESTLLAIPLTAQIKIMRNQISFLCWMMIRMLGSESIWSEGESSKAARVNSNYQLLHALRLPPEVSWELFLELNPVDVSKCGLVSRSWRAFARNETLWREICKKAWLGKQFHPLELHPLVNWGIYNNISVAESMQILKRRGVVIRGPTTTQPPCANWPSSTYPVNLSSWSWTHWQPSDHSPTLAIGWEHTAVPDLDDDASDEERYSKEIIQKVQQPEQENAFPSERDLPWLERLLSVTLPAHAPPAIPTSCGKWMASYVAAERDRTRTLITRSELTRIKWKLQHGRDIGNAVFQEDGLWFSDVWPHHEWWRIRRDGRPQVNFYAPLTVQRRDGSNSSPNDWGFVMTNEFSVFVSTDRNPPPISITMTGRTTYQ